MLRMILFALRELFSPRRLSPEPETGIRCPLCNRSNNARAQALGIMACDDCADL